MDKNKYDAVCAVDFGTHGIGFAFSFSEDEIHILQHPHSPSVKTLNWILVDKSKGTLKAYGYEGRKKYCEMRPQEQQKYAAYSGYKMSLCVNDNSRSTLIKSQNGEDECDIETLLAFTLQAIKETALEKMKLANPNTSAEKILWVETVPAIWDPAAKQVMVKAAVKAGLCLPDHSNLILALEPEAAALQCRSEKNFQMQDGVKFMVVDAGGGTVDITCHRVVKGGLEELIAPDGGPWGASYIDQHFEIFLRKVFGGESIEQLRTKKSSDWLAILQEFESRKRLSESDENEAVALRIVSELLSVMTQKTLNSKVEQYNNTVPNEQRIDLQDKLLWLEPCTFMSFQMPLINQIKKKVAQLLEREELQGLEYLQLVGGFAESPFLRKEMANLLHGKNIKLVIPNRPGSAVLLGAVRYGFNPLSIQNRVSSMTIGIEKLQPWEESIHPENKKVVLQGKEYCRDLFHVLVRAGETLSSKTEISEIFHPSFKGQKQVTIPIVTTIAPCVTYTDETAVMHAGDLHLALPEQADVNTEIKVTISFGGTVFCVRAESEGHVAKAEIEWDLQLKPKLQTKYQSLDLCVLMDCTGSMQNWIDETKNKIVDICNTIVENNPGVRIRTAFVGYRDFGDAKRFEIAPFTEDVVSIRNLLENIEALGGGDQPEDVEGGLQQVLKLDWQSTCRVLIHVADAPCHGTSFHDFEDHHPYAESPIKVVSQLFKNGIGYNFVKIKPDTDTMTTIFGQLAEEHNGKFEIRDLKSDTNLFMPTVLEFVSNSIAS